MKTVILCGGRGTRLAEETGSLPKPMVTIGGYPILWHIMNIYGSQGFSDFVLALGYKGRSIKEYFLHYYALSSDLRVDLSSGELEYKRSGHRDWKIDLINTGEKTLTGGRLLRLKDELAKDGTFMLTYGDGVADVDLNELLTFHRSHGKLATVTSVRPSGRFGGMTVDGSQVKTFAEKKNQSDEGWINGGFFILEPGVFDYLVDDGTIFERDPLENLAQDGQLMSYFHKGYWQCMDSVRERELLEQVWASGDAPWKLWSDSDEQFKDFNDKLEQKVVNIRK